MRIKQRLLILVGVAAAFSAFIALYVYIIKNDKIRTTNQNVTATKIHPNSNSYDVLVGQNEIIFVTYFDPEDAQFGRRNIATVDSKNAQKLIELKNKFDKYLRIDKIEDLDNVYLLKISAHDHGDFTDFYALIFDPKNETILFDSGELSKRRSTATYMGNRVMKICYASEPLTPLEIFCTEQRF